MSDSKRDAEQSGATVIGGVRVVARPSVSAQPVPAPVNYHHGALRAALLEATGQILLEQGIEGFTLRACARRAGVSHGAPAHHFGDVKGLLTAFAALGYERLTEMMQAYRVRAGADPYMQLAQVGQAYVDFALAHRAQFQLMFRTDRLDETDPHFARAAMDSFDQLDAVLAGFLNAQGSFDQAVLAKLVLAWSTVHGFATLLLEGRMQYFFKDKTRDEFASEMGSQMLALLKHALAVTDTEAGT